MVNPSIQPSQSPSEDLSCDPPHKFRRMQQLEDLFRDDPNGVFAVQSVYVKTPEFGVVTVVRRKALNGIDPDTYSIGINTNNQDWPSLKYVFDHDLLPGPLSLVNAAGKVSAVVAYTIIPSAIELLDAVVTSVQRAPNSRSFYIPAQPNLGYCTFRQSR